MAGVAQTTKQGRIFVLDRVTGEPLFPPIRDGWQFVSQQDERYPWGNSVLGIRAPIMLAFACKMTGEADLKETFDRFLDPAERGREPRAAPTATPSRKPWPRRVPRACL